MKRDEALRAGKTRYTGNACQRHPEIAGLRYVSNYTCVACDRESSRVSSERNKDKRQAYGREYRAANQEALAAKDKERRTDPVSREKFLEYQRRYTKENRPNDAERSALRRQSPEYRAKQVERKRLWREKNREAHRAATREYENAKRREDIQWRLAKNLRHRLSKAVRGQTTGVSAVRDLGMSIPDFKSYLEARFLPGMTWANYGEWHIDHRRPLSSFDLTSDDEVRTACHYTNLQPLWAKDNQSKHAKLTAA